jgi:hypothetical protein
MLPNDNNLILVDAHVHIHSNYNLDKFFDSAFDNFRHVSQNNGDSKNSIGVLCLAEGKNKRAFQDLRELADCKGDIDTLSLVNKTIDQTGEDISLKVTSEQAEIIFLIAGRQIVTREKLEVLALGTSIDFKDGSPIDNLITEIAEDGAIPVIPWGFGKWVGKRSKLLRDTFKNDQLSRFFIGDNGNRPKFCPESALFGVAKKNKIINMPGSDPLPFIGECNRAGCFGFAIQGSLNMKEPWKDLKKKLLDPNMVFEYFGEFESPLRFLRNQLAMQYHKRFYG